MNVLLITEFFPSKKEPLISGGVQARTFFVAEYLKKKHKVEVISFNGGKIEAIPTSLFPRLVFALSIVFAKPKNKPDIVEASNVTTYLAAFLLAKRLGVQAIAWVPDILGESWVKYFSVAVALVGQALELVSMKLPWTHTIAMSKTTRDKLIDLGVKKEKISVVYGGVEYERLAKLKVKKYKNPTICSIARLLPYKRLEDLIQAVSLVKKRHPNIRCLIIGEGPGEKNLKSQILKLELSDKVKMLGKLPHAQATKILKKSHVFCLPSVVEGFGIVTVEAMAAGVPFVNARIKPTVEITEGGKGGLLYEPKDSFDLAEKIVKLLSDSNLYRKKQNEGLRLSKHFDWDIISRQTEAVYKYTLNV